MIDPIQLGVFVIATLALVVTPGPAVLYVVAQAIDGGVKAGVVSALGIALGGMVHVLLASVGISALVIASNASTLAFTVIKWIGAGYLIYLGFLKLFEKVEKFEVTRKSHSNRRIFWNAVIVQIFNPKVALFFLAFLPQFVTVDHGSVEKQVFILGLIFTVLALLTDFTYGQMAGRVGKWLEGNPQFLKFQKFFPAFTYIVLGVGTASQGFILFS